MKNLKKFAAIFMALVMTLSMTVNVFADTPAEFATQARDLLQQDTHDTALRNAAAGAEQNDDAIRTAVVGAMNTAIAGIDTANVTVNVAESNIIVALPVNGTPGNPAGTPGSISGTFRVDHTTEPNTNNATGTLRTITFGTPTAWTPITGPTTGVATITVAGDLINVNRERFEFVLPSDIMFDFVLDPLGLATVQWETETETGTSTVTHVAVPGTPGLIVPQAPGGQVLNLSSVPASLTVSYRISTAANANIISNTALTVGDYQTAVNAGETNNVLLYLAPAYATRTALVDETAEPVFVPHASDATRVFPVTQTLEYLEFRFNAAPHRYALNDAGDWIYEIVDASSGFGTAFQVGGRVSTNPALNWTGADVRLSLVFRFLPSPIHPTNRNEPLLGGEEPYLLTTAPLVGGLVTANANGSTLPWNIEITSDSAAATLVNVAPLEPSLGPVNPVVNIPVNSWERIPFIYGDYTIAEIRIGNFVLPEGGQWFSSAANRLDNVLVVNFPTVGTRNFIIELSNGAEFPLQINVT